MTNRRRISLAGVWNCVLDQYRYGEQRCFWKAAPPSYVVVGRKRAGMSVSVFHHNFQLVTDSSPLQYIKRVRLDRARTLMAYDGHSAGTAAAQVGYESVSQFGREFKRLFGTPPAEEAASIRARLAVGGEA